MKTKSLLIALLIFASMAVKATGNLSSAEAMFIYNFLRHVEWPQGSTGEKFVIGVYGRNQTYDQLLTYTTNRKVGTRSIEVKIISSVQEAARCQLVFIPESQTSKIREIKNTLGNAPCLIVGEREGSNAAGSTIEFVILDNKLKFRIDENQAKTQNLLISKALLDMAI
jgi:hypothetical protein